MSARETPRWTSDEFKRAINKHTFEDATHSRLFLEDWRKLGLDSRLGWGAGDTIAWYYASRETEIFRQYGMEVMKMCALHEDPHVRFSFMDAIEACGHVFFTSTFKERDRATARGVADVRGGGARRGAARDGVLAGRSHLRDVPRRE